MSTRRYRSSQLRGIGGNEIDYADGCDRFIANVVLPDVRQAHPVVGVIWLMPIGMIAGLHRAFGAGLIAQADRMEAEHHAAKLTAALKRGAKAHGVRWEAPVNG
jgi:hypothetical protein